jgi:mannose-6-phosphate isomerase
VYKFEPILKTLVWGTESWVLSSVPGSESVVSEGPEAGKTLSEVYGGEFPLLIKFIDARKDLSIQVHPGDELAWKRHGGHGKDEMWYIIGASEGAHLYSGLAKPLTPEEYARRVEDGTIINVLGDHVVAPGDVFFIPSGRIHSICGGCYLAEIQQTSDITYRIYDYKRKDKDGNYRQLHTQEAAESIDFKVQDDYRTHYTPLKNESQLLVDCPYFSTAVYDLTESMSIDYTELDSFVILIGLKGEATLTIDGEDVNFKGGECLLIPATVQEVSTCGTIKFLETYVLS